MTKKDLMEAKNYNQLERCLIKMGFTETTKKSGSHRIFKGLYNNKAITVSVPCHSRGGEVAIGTRRNIAKLIFA